MRVTVRTVQGDMVVMDVQPTATVLETVRRAAAQFSADPETSSLVFRGSVLKEFDAIRDVGIVDGSCLILARRRTQAAAAPAAAKPDAAQSTPSPQPIELHVKRVGSEETPSRVKVETSGTLETIIHQLKRQWDVSSIRLVHGGRLLHPEQTVSDTGLQDGMTLFGMVSQATVAPAAAEAAAAALHGNAESDDDDDMPQVEAQEERESAGTTNDGAETCRICHGGREFERELGPLFSPCRCRGTVASVHVECLNRWRRMSSNPSSYFACDQCGYRYQIDRTRWARWAETTAAAEITTVLACALIVCAAAVPCYYLAVHKQFVSSLIRSSCRAYSSANP